MAGNVRSWKNLWALMSEKSVLKSTNLIGNELQDNAECLLSGILYYKKPDNSSLDKLKQTVDDTQFEFLSKFSKLIEVDALQCLELFMSYVQYEYKGTQKNLKNLLSSERHEQTMLFEMWNHYFSERLYCLLTMKHVLEYWHDSTNSYKTLYEDFMDCMDKERVVISKIISQMEALLKVEVPNTDTHGAHMNQVLAYLWATSVLKEQCELLQLMLLYYKYVDPTVEEIKRIFSISQRCGFGFRQSFRQFIIEDNSYLVEMIRYLETFVVLQCLRLDVFCGLQEDVSDISHFLLKDQAALKDLDSIMQTLGSLESHGPILLAWMILGQSSNSHLLLCNSHKFGTLAMQLNVFAYILKTLQSASVSQKGAVASILHSLVYNLLCLVLSQFELHTLGSLEPIFKILELLLKFPDIADDFWSKGLECGAGLLLKHSVERFPVEFHTLINLSASLAQAGKNSSKKVLKFIKSLPVIAEHMETVSTEDITATQDSSVFHLLRNRALYGDANLMLPKGTVGVVTTDGDKSQALIQWQTFVNGWQICLRELHFKLQDISVSMGAVSSDSLSKITCIANLIHSLLQSDLETKDSLRHIINMIFSVLHRLSIHPSPPLDLMAKCLDIAAILFQRDSSVWMTVVQMNLIPSVTELPKDMTELSSGVCMSMGTLGELIASKECVFGKYPLCISFLNLINSVSKNVPVDDGDSFLGCVLYILREIFSSFHKWCYIDPQEKIIIGESCLNLFHVLFTIESQEKSDALERISKMCIFNLLYFEAGQTLLRIVCTSEEVIQQTIMKQNSYFGEKVAGLIRLSFSVLNRLLLLRHYVLTPQQNSLGESPFEKVLFSTPGHSEQPQVVLTVANYAFQYYNPRLATLAVQLLKRFAKEFPMSLLACFGSEAEAIRDHFLSRLSSPYEDIRLKVSILEFLTVCIAQQPGLIEMFINVCVKDKEEEKAGNKDQSCLTSVKNILTEKPERKDDYFQDLQCVAVEFVHAVWAGHQGLAMEALKKDSEFWTFLCKSLFSEDLDMMHPKIVAYIIRTLALEFFYISSSVGCSFSDCGGKMIMKKISDGKLLEKWSEYVNNISLKDDFNASRLDILDRSIVSDDDEALALYTAWRDFLLVLAKCECTIGLKISSATKVTIMDHILRNLLNQIEDQHSRLMIMLSESYLMLFHHWKGEFSTNCNTTLDSVQKLIQDLAINSDNTHPRVQLAVVSIAIYVITACSVKDKTGEQLKDWVLPVCKLLRKSTILIERLLKNEDSSVLKLPIAIICLLNKLVEETTDWLPVLKSQIVLPLLVSLLTKSLKLQFGLRLALSIITLFVSVAATSKAAEALCNTGFMAETTLILSVVKLDFEVSKTNSSLVPVRKVTCTDVYYAFLRLLRTLLQSLGNYFLQDALNFIGSHLEKIHDTFDRVKQAPHSTNLQDVTLTCAFVYQLSFHQQTWQLEHPKSLQILLNDVSFCIHSAIALLIRPNLLKHLVEQSEHPRKKIPIANDGNDTRLQRVYSEEEAVPSERVVQVQTQLLELLAVCLSTMQQYSPGLYETMSDHRIDHGQWQLFLDLTFQTPSVDQEAPASFGDVLACVNICLKWLTKNDRTPSPGKTAEYPSQIEMHLLLYVLEISLTLLVSQCSLALTHPEIHKSHKQLIRRELASELNMVMQSVNRHLRRGPLSPATSNFQTSVPQRPLPQTSELPFMKLINSLVNRLVK